MLYHLGNDDDGNETLTFEIGHEASPVEVLSRALEVLGWSVFDGPGLDYDPPEGIETPLGELLEGE